MAEILQRRISGDSNGFVGQTPDWMKRVLMARGVLSLDQLSSDLSRMLAPDLMLGVDQGVALLARAIRQDQKILIMGDYDADGATSCALAVRALGAMGAQHVDFLVPDRFEFGYGLSPEIVEVASRQNPDLLVTVDNGISSLAGVDRANELGIEVLITDHHLPGAQLPNAAAIVNPNQAGCTFPSKNLAGVGVLFNLMVALRTELRQQNWFEEKQIPAPNLGHWLDIVAVGTVADLVPLDDNNRLLVRRGLDRIRSGQGNPGIRALLEIAGKSVAIVTSTDLGFVVGPRINAAGRLEDISIGVRCLLTDSEEQARLLASQLHQLNQDRRLIEQQMRQEAELAMQELQLDTEVLPWGICLFNADWHSGVVGLIASRIKDKFHRPTLVFAQENSGKLKGSGRSISGFHLRDALEAVATRHPDLIDQFGGHAMAAGLSIQSGRYEEFALAFDQEVKNRIDPDSLVERLLTDGELPSLAINLDSARLIEEISPWGQAFPEPIFEGEFEIESVRVLNDAHLKMRLLTPETGRAVEAIWFSVPDQYLSLGAGEAGRFVYRLAVNRYRGNETEQLMIEAYFSV